jgi:2-methylisocitrate lyase-like PEP mutase family enzyme
MLPAMLRNEKGILLPGAPNALAARIIAEPGFRAVYLTAPDSPTCISTMEMSWRAFTFLTLPMVVDDVAFIDSARPLTFHNGAHEQQCLRYRP